MNTKRIVALLALCACGQSVEYRVGASDGIPAIQGSKEFDISGYTCGNPISAQGYTVTTRVTGSDCEFTFDQVVTIVKDTDYKNIPSLMGSTNLVQAIELDVKTLAFYDATGTTATMLDFNSYVKSVTLKVEGQAVADKSTLSKLPVTVKLEGEALTGIKAQIDKRVPATAHATAILLVPMSPAPPNKIKVNYDAQPTLVVGTGKINLGQ